MLRGRRGEDRLATFLRGLVAGAFVGAAIVGSAAWWRIRRRAGSGQAKPTAADPRTAGGARDGRRGGST